MNNFVVPAVRLRDWQERLAKLFRERSNAPFGWGINDCVLFAADDVQACTGVDVACDVRGQWQDETQAMRVLRAHGGLAELCIARLGPVIPAALAQPGDVGLVSIHGRPSLAVCGGPHFHAPGALGLEVIDAACAQRAWRITREDIHG